MSDDAKKEILDGQSAISVVKRGVFLQGALMVSVLQTPIVFTETKIKRPAGFTYIAFLAQITSKFVH